ncbi:MAG TPA: DNA-formamidopyrimidine glycosylase family protein [Jiangellaceae bacterium]|nr:DNA-formamidopyrimidine glycosylase family protein [Jiangellaceae bacterium]
MPEGDTVWRTARHLHRAMAGQQLTASDLRVPKLATSDVTGYQTMGVVSRGKHLLHRLDHDGHALTQHSHLRMDGSWRLTPKAQSRSASLRGHTVRAVLETEHWTAVGANLGMLDLVRTTDEALLVGHLGPDILANPWDEEAALANLCQASEETLGTALLDQRNVAGIGAIYASESLFLQRQSPWIPDGDVAGSQLAAVVARARKLMLRSCTDGVSSTTGSTRRDERTWVHGRSGQPCRRCRTTVRVAMIGLTRQQRTMFYCPRCQGGLAPTDDARGPA